MDKKLKYEFDSLKSKENKEENLINRFKTKSQSEELDLTKQKTLSDDLQTEV